VGSEVSVDSETILVTDFVNLKIKSAQSFRVAHRGIMYARVFVGVSDRICISFYVCTVFLKKINIFCSSGTSWQMKLQPRA
jgi:hypothetical protein